ncbi:hypothetical protein OESDEN_17579 [Oesophagostomum dentatum]|uniref:Uncharacterized protein n=1 Tax=Oesophagostomum dentatum TaxID=61180 RepID=A0A0B1SFR7_OESDE|nr:hypothetical protein OESDEN_17579 [Oesophagostomum dentatum]
MILNTAQSLFEVAGTMPAHGTLFLETACQIWAKQGRCEEKISIDYDHEVEVAVEEVCSAEDSGLHPSDAAWVDYCQSRIERPERYGQRTIVLAKCVNVLFKYLDYGSNRADARAWVLLHAAVQFVDPALLIPLWRERYDWWPRSHTVPLPPEAESRRGELLAALATTPIE